MKRNKSHEKLIYDRCISASFPNFMALVIVAQSKHETAFGGVPYMSPLFLRANNAFGYGRLNGDPDQLPGGAGKHPEDSGVYAKYTSLDKCMNDIIQYYTKRFHKFKNITTLEAFAQQLKVERYFTDSAVNYAKGLKRWFKNSIV